MPRTLDLAFFVAMTTTTDMADYFLHMRMQGNKLVDSVSDYGWYEIDSQLLHKHHQKASKVW